MEKEDRGQNNPAAYSDKVRVRELRAVVCSGDADDVYVVRALLKQKDFPIPKGLIEAIVRPNAAKDCPVSAALSEQEKTDLKKLAKDAQAGESKP